MSSLVFIVNHLISKDTNLWPKYFPFYYLQSTIEAAFTMLSNRALLHQLSEAILSKTILVLSVCLRTPQAGMASVRFACLRAVALNRQACLIQSS